MQAFRRQNMRLKASQHGIERHRARSHGVSHGRQADRHAFQGIALGLAVQRLMLTKLLEQDRGQEAWPGPAPRDDMEGRWRLADRVDFVYSVPAEILQQALQPTIGPAEIEVVADPGLERRARQAGLLVLGTLQQRLLSSIAAFRRKDLRGGNVT